MNMRKQFDHHLTNLEELLFEMYHLSVEALNKSMSALTNQNVAMANEVIKQDDLIDQLEHEINNKAILLIAKEAPVATDLRKIIVALKISSEIERIGDMAVNIAKSVLHIGEEKYIKPIVDIPKMLDKSVQMFHHVMQSFKEEDVSKARSCAIQDDEVDQMYGTLVQELMSYIPEKRESINQITQLAFICRYIERVADHVTNISEQVIYLVTGNRYELNS